MQPDISRLLYEKYSKLNNKNIELTLINGRTISGIIIGYFMGEEDNFDSRIIGWHIVQEKDKMSLGIDQFGFMIGEIIYQKDLLKIYFKEDNSTMQINSK